MPSDDNGLPKSDTKSNLNCFVLNVFSFIKALTVHSIPLPSLNTLHRPAQICGSDLAGAVLNSPIW